MQVMGNDIFNLKKTSERKSGSLRKKSDEIKGKIRELKKAQQTEKLTSLIHRK